MGVEDTYSREDEDQRRKSGGGYAAAIDDPGRFRSSEQVGHISALRRGAIKPARPSIAAASARLAMLWCAQRLMRPPTSYRPPPHGLHGVGRYESQRAGMKEATAALARKLAVILIAKERQARQGQVSTATRKQRTSCDALAPLCYAGLGPGFPAPHIERGRERRQSSVQSSIRNPAIRENSPVLLVMSIRLRALAWPAMSTS